MILLLWLACATEAPPPPPPPVAPRVRVDPDAAPLAALGIPGAGEGKRFRVRHHLLLPDAEAADSAAIAVTALGLRVEADQAGEAGEVWELQVWEDTQLDPTHVAEHRAALEALVAESGGSYDGWEAEALPVAPRPPPPPEVPAEPAPEEPPE